MMKFRLSIFIFLLLPHFCYGQDSTRKADHVILISFDGLRPDAITALGPYYANAFYKMIREGASTFNARTDDNFTVTLPNHTCMLTGYTADDPQGHHLFINSMMVETIHDLAGKRVYSIFDTLRENHRHSAMLASKLKFSIYQNSFPIDTVSLTNQDDYKTLSSFKSLLEHGLPDFTFIHFAGTDRVGHRHGWDVTPDSLYMKQVEILNGYLGTILNDIKSLNRGKESTVIIVTSDHGGEGLSHSNINNPRDFTIPLIIWGKPVANGVDLYTINKDRRKDPGNRRISNQEEWQPIRNGDVANLALSLLGLPPVQDSTIGNKKPLRISKDPN